MVVCLVAVVAGRLLLEATLTSILHKSSVRIQKDLQQGLVVRDPFIFSSQVPAFESTPLEAAGRTTITMPKEAGLTRFQSWETFSTLSKAKWERS